MAFRTLVIKNRCKLEYSLNYIVCRKHNEEVKILLDEVKTIVIDSLQVSLTSYLISELVNKNIKVIFIDAKHNPACEMIPYKGNSYSYRHIKEQIAFKKDFKEFLWQQIVKEKITNQSRVLKKHSFLGSYEKLLNYVNEVEPNDSSNREGHAAKVYFNTLFGKDFSRKQDSEINKFLNYGYAIILSTINREIVIHGFLPDIGIHHIGESNPFNLACDFIEPLRQIVDDIVVSGVINNNNYIEKLVEILGKNVTYQNKTIILENAIHLYIEDLLNFMNTGDVDKIRFINYEI